MYLTIINNIKREYKEDIELQIKQNFENKLIDFIFIFSAVSFNIFVSLVYLANKFENDQLLKVSGLFVIILIIPFSITFYSYINKREKTKIILSNIIIIFYLFFELLLDYILLIPFREIIAIHVPYIVIFYAAEFSMLGVSFEKNKKLGFLVLFTFIILLCFLVYLYLL